MDFFTATAERDKAITRVGDNSSAWLTQSLDYIKDLPSGRLMTGEWLRLCITSLGFPKPHHHNAWGALINTAIKRGLLKETGRWVKMRALKSHGRRTPEYIRT